RAEGAVNGVVKRARPATEARAEVVGDKPSEERVFARSRHEDEINRAENVASGLPPNAPNQPPVRESDPSQRKRDYREPRHEVPAEVKEENEVTPLPAP